jgi:hypothetical protein
MVQQIVQQFACVVLGAPTGTDREVEPAVGESFAMMFEEQFAPMPSGEHDSTVPYPTRAVPDARAWQASQ